MSKQKHPNIVNVNHIEPRIEEKAGKFGYRGRRLGVNVGARALGASVFEIEPGRQAFPHHFHSANEEAAFVLEGRGKVRIGKDEIDIEAGDYIAFPVGPEHAHSIRNTSNATLKLLCISTLHPVEVVGYPDSKKIAAVAMADSSKGLMSGAGPWVRMIVREQTSLEYYDGEV